MRTISKRLKAALLSLATGAMLLPGCNLSEDPESFVTSKDFYQNKEQCLAALNSCYIPLRSIFKFTYLFVTEGTSDLMWCASGTVDAQLAMTPARPLFGQTMWTQGYKGVVYCNGAIEGIKSSPIPDEDKTQLLGEGMVMRAYYYYFLTSTFGDVPFYTEDVSDLEALNRVSRLGRMPADATREYLINELLDIVPKMKQERTFEADKHRSGAAMGWMLIAKMAAWNKQWEVVRDACLELEKLYGPLAQYDYADVQFRNKNTPESIFEVQHTYASTGLQVTTNIAAVCMPTRRSGTTLFDGVDIPEWGNETTTWTALRPNAYFFQSMQTEFGTDKRFAYNLAVEYNGVRFATANTRPWLGPKFWCPGMKNTLDGNNMKVFRYADAVLLLAEAYMELNDNDKAIARLNEIKARAEITLYGAFVSKDMLFEEIMKERARELFGEFNRKYDLVRWGIWYRQTYDYSDYASIQKNIMPCHEYYPIPDKEVVYSGYNLDNDEYTKYGL